MKNKLLNNIKKAIILLSVCGLADSCKRLIEIPAQSPSQLSTPQQFADSTTTMTAVANVYSYPNGSKGFSYNDGLLPVCAGLSSDELLPTGGYSDDLQFYAYGLLPNNNYITGLWNDPYSAIYGVNAILEGVAGSKTLTASFKQQITAEMKVVRSLYYFNLINLFGAVPLVTTADYLQTAHIARTSTDSIYAQIITDLTDAQQSLSVNYPASDRYRPNQNVAAALLSKVYLYREQWQKAYELADGVIGSGIYSLETDLTNVFLDGNNEAIWQVPAMTPYSGTKEATNFTPVYNPTPNYIMTTFMIDAFEAGDQRLQQWVGITQADTGTGTINLYYPNKYRNVYPPYANQEDYSILRLAELYLIRAEAAAHLGNTALALSDLNLVRARAGLSPGAATTATDLLKAIMKERQTELFTEWGNRWFDLKRTGTAAAVLSAEKTGWNATDTLYPVPSTQLLLNNLLKQNPGYN